MNRFTVLIYVSCSALGLGNRSWLYYPSSDVLWVNETIFPESNVTGIDALKALCEATPSCIGFNSNGWLKNGSSSIASNPVDLYLLTDSPAPDVPLVWPRPLSISVGSSALVLPPSFAFEASTPSADLTAAFQRTLDLMFSNGPGGNATSRGVGAYPLLQTIVVRVSDVTAPLQLGVNESYTLVLPSDGSAGVITSATVFGAYAALQTLTQLVSFDFDQGVYWAGSPTTISDSPRFPWRGLMVDPARHFIPPSVLRSTVDAMSYSKLNTLHMHVVDCDSWPLQVPSLSKLWQAAFSPRERYTTAELQSLVEYGRARGVRVVFEFDTPGHAGSMCVGYPDLCPSLTCREPLNPASNETLPAIQTVLSELAGLSLDDTLHLGGDEVDGACWQQSPQIVAWMAAHGLNNTDEIYEYFVSSTNTMAVALKKSPVRWEEVWKHFRTDLDPSTIIQCWLSSAALADATNNGYRAIFSVNEQYYLDYTDTTWDVMYNTDPLGGQPNMTAQTFVLGGEAAMWGESVDASNVLATIWPRAAAVAERLWTYDSSSFASDYDVITRLAAFRCLLLERGVPAPITGNQIAGSPPPSWTVGSCMGGYKQLC